MTGTKTEAHACAVMMRTISDHLENGQGAAKYYKYQRTALHLKGPNKIPILYKLNMNIKI